MNSFDHCIATAIAVMRAAVPEMVVGNLPVVPTYPMATPLAAYFDATTQLPTLAHALADLVQEVYQCRDAIQRELQLLQSDIAGLVEQFIRDVMMQVPLLAHPQALIRAQAVTTLTSLPEHYVRASQHRLADAATRLLPVEQKLAALTPQILDTQPAPGASYAAESTAAGDAGTDAAAGDAGTDDAERNTTAGDAGTGDAGGAQGTPANSPSAQGAAAVAAAESMLGTPYVWGGTSPGGFDCSGLTHWAWQQAGVTIPRTAAAQASGTPVAYEDLAPGDLVVWDGHVAMYAGDGQMIEAGNPVQKNPLRTSNMGMQFLGYFRPN